MFDGYYRRGEEIFYFEGTYHDLDGGLVFVFRNIENSFVQEVKPDPFELLINYTENGWDLDLKT